MNIAIAGPMGSGKSTVAGILRDKHGFQIVTLAEPLYRAADLGRQFIKTDDVFPIEIQTFWRSVVGPHLADQAYRLWMRLAWEHVDLLCSGEKPRAFLIDMGTAIREIGESAFVVYALLNTRQGNWVCDDLRMRNEAELLYDADWRLVRVDPGDRVLKPEGIEYQKHETETDLDDWTDWDGVIRTEGPMEDLPAKVQSLLQQLAGQ
jgi:hypothetical protein